MADYQIEYNIAVKTILKMFPKAKIQRHDLRGVHARGSSSYPLPGGICSIVLELVDRWRSETQRSKSWTSKVTTYLKIGSVTIDPVARGSSDCPEEAVAIAIQNAMNEYDSIVKVVSGQTTSLAECHSEIERKRR